MNTKQIGNYIKKQRNNLGFTQAEIAEPCFAETLAP